MRLRRTEDVDLIKRLHETIFFGDYWEAGHAYWVLTEGVRNIGFCAAKKVDGGGGVFLLRAGVKSLYRGAGLQRRMIRIRERWAANEGASYCITYTMPNNWSSIVNLLKAGYKTYDPQWAWAGRDVVYWRRKVTPQT